MASLIVSTLGFWFEDWPWILMYAPPPKHAALSTKVVPSTNSMVLPLLPFTRTAKPPPRPLLWSAQSVLSLSLHLAMLLVLVLLENEQFEILNIPCLSGDCMRINSPTAANSCGLLPVTARCINRELEMNVDPHTLIRDSPTLLPE